MKKAIFTFYLSLSLFIGQIIAQPCGNSGPGVCTPSGQFVGGGFEDPNVTACIEQGVAFSHAIQFTMYSTFTFPGVGQVTVDSVQFNTISNLPCGLCWATTKTNNRYAADEDGCIRISGTSTDAVGQYKLSLTLSAWINGGSTPIPVPANLVDQTPIKMYLRVKSQGGACASVDTSSGATNLTASTTCPTGINEVNIGVSGISLTPNPVSSTSALSFIAEKTALYTISISDVTGKVVSTRQYEAKQGANSMSVEKGALTSGIYFLSISDGKNAMTNRFTITD